MKKVMIFGTFDFFHSGHLDFFKQAKRHGDHLIVVVGRGATVQKVKGAPPIQNERERMDVISHIDLVDTVVLGGKHDMYEVIRRYAPDVIALGYDQIEFTSTLQAELKKSGLHTTVVRLKPYKARTLKSAHKKKHLKI